MSTHQPGSFPDHPTAFPGPYRYTGDLPVGEWRMLANGRVFVFDVTHAQGTNVEATLSSGLVTDIEYTAFANASTLARLEFNRVLPAQGLKQRFVGWLLHYSDPDPLWRLAGHFGKAGEPASAGWYATLPRKK